jgi:hypothetical protein
MIKLGIPKVTKAAQIRSYVAANPKAKSIDVANAVGVTPAYVATVMWTAKKKAGIKKKSAKLAPTLARLMKETKVKKAMEKHKKVMDNTISDWKQLGLFSSNTPMVKDTVTKLSPNRMAQLAYEAGKAKFRMEGDRGDAVNHPAHYKVGGIETIDFIEAKKLGYNLGNVVKYLTRADHKGNKLEDLRKAQWYLTREISSLK